MSLPLSRFIGPQSTDLRSKYQPTNDHVFRSPWGPFPEVPEDLNVHEFCFPPNEPLQPDYDLFIDGHTGSAVTLHQFYDRVCALSRALRYDGPNPLNLGRSPIDDRDDGEILGIFSRNHICWPLLSHSCFRAELVFGGISPGSTPFELYHVMCKMQITSIVVHESLLPVLQETIKLAPGMQNASPLPFSLDTRKIIVLSDSPDLDTVFGYTTLEALVRQGQKMPEQKRKLKGGSKLCYLFQSSGTSGLPKAMMITHKNAIYCGMQGMITGPQTAEFVCILLHIYQVFANEYSLGSRLLIQ